MYLTLLKHEEKKLFLNLVVILASSDGNYSDKEKSMINGYCQEMGIPYMLDNQDSVLEDVVSKINQSCDTKTKKIMVFEAIGLAVSDNIFHQSERVIIKKMMDIFKLDKGFDEKCEAAINEYMSFQTKLNELVIG